MGLDKRIGPLFLNAGLGYGGSCFPKDVKALIHMAEENQFEPTLLNAVEARNEEQKKLLFRKITRRFGVDLQGRTFAIWGLAFKPGTDDMREAPSLVLLQELIAAGASVKAYDPVAMDSARREIPAEWISSGRVRLMEEQYAALDGADAMVLVTEWKPFRHPDFDRIKSMLKTPVIFDGRNQYDRNLLRQSGFEYVGIGR